MEFTKPQALNDSLVESDTEETKDRGSESSSSAKPAQIQPKPIVEKADEPENQ